MIFLERLHRLPTVLLGYVERAGNLLPHPATIFAFFALAVVGASGIIARLGLEVTHPGTGEVIHAVNLLSLAGLHRMLTGMVTNFTSFAPLGTVVVAMLGIGVMESSGLIGSGLRLLVLKAPARLLTFVIVFAGVMSNAATEVGYVLIVPLAGMIFLAAGRHPIAGLAAAFAGVSGGYSANLMLGAVDPLLAGLTQEAAHIVEPSYRVNAACNYYFMVASTFLITAAGAWVTEKIVEPRLGPYEGDVRPEALENLTAAERRGLHWAVLVAVAITVLVLFGTIPADGFLRNPETGSLLNSPLLQGIVAFIFIAGAVLGIAYGVGAGTIRSDADVEKGMSSTMSTLGGYMVLVFFASQFVAYFNWSRLGLIVAVKGAEVLKASGMGGVALMLTFVCLSAILNLFMGSSSAKWAVMAPVFVPMLMLLGYTPELTQAAYRVGDSSTNIITPMMSYFALIVAFVERYDKRAGIGTVMATMLPYTIAFLVIWSVLLTAWILLDLPLGPGALLMLPS